MICYFHADMDGRCSAAIVNYFYDGNKESRSLAERREFAECDYGKPLPIPLEQVQPNEQVFIVDFSLSNDDMAKLLEVTKNVTWIDHHITAIERLGDLELDGILENGTAACVLTWRYFCPAMDWCVVPMVVKLLGDYDVWRFTFGEDTKFLQEGIRTFDTSPTSRNWSSWFTNDKSLDELINYGKIITTYKMNHFQELLDASGFRTTLKGYRVVACNAARTSSALFNSVDPESYDIMLPFYFNGDQWTVSLYTKRKDIDVSEIAKSFGGGGHRQAAGFNCKVLPFVKETPLFE